MSAEEESLKEAVGGANNERTDEAVIPTEQDKVCCGCCSVIGAFYAFSVEYIVVALVLFALFGAVVGELPDESWWVSAIIFIAALSRLFVGIFGIYCTRVLSNTDPNDTPSESLINLWAFLMLWIPIIFNSLWIFFTTGLIYALATWGNGGDFTFEQLLAIGAFQSPPIIDMIIAITFYIMMNRYVEKTTNRVVQACPCCNCC